MNKLQLEAITKTLTTRVENHIKAKSELAIKKLKPTAEAEKLMKEYQTIYDKVEAYNDKVRASDKMGYIIDTPSRWNSPKFHLALYGYTSVHTTGHSNMSIVPELAEEARTKFNAIDSYILNLTLGTETVDGVEAFLAKLLK
jgi:hypothetical protein